MLRTYSSIAYLFSNARAIEIYIHLHVRRHQNKKENFSTKKQYDETNVDKPGSAYVDVDVDVDVEFFTRKLRFVISC